MTTDTADMIFTAWRNDHGMAADVVIFGRMAVATAEVQAINGHMDIDIAGWVGDTGIRITMFDDRVTTTTRNGGHAGLRELCGDLWATEAGQRQERDFQLAMKFNIGTGAVMTDRQSAEHR